LIHIVLETDVLYFERGKAEIKDSALAILQYAAKLLERNPNVIMHISGFTDDIGNFRNNLLLSYERSNAARKYLMNAGISKERIIISGYGNDNPAKANDSPENRAKNRRIELKLLLPL
jgi:outer membrane protein OmpA-like peptidoglycan-associated protein